AQVAAAGRSEGLVFNHDKMERTPNTVDAHRLIWLAGQQGKQEVVVEGLFAAYFNEGRYGKSKTRISELSPRAVMVRPASSFSATPSPPPAALPLTSTDPRTTWTQLLRPGFNWCLTEWPLASSVS